MGQGEYTELLFQGSYLGTSKGLNFFLGVDVIYMKPCGEQKEKFVSGVFFF